MNKRRILRDAIKSIAILSIIALLGFSFLSCDSDGGGGNGGGGDPAAWEFGVYTDTGNGGTSTIEKEGSGTEAAPYTFTGNVVYIDPADTNPYGYAGVTITPDAAALSHLKQADSIQFKTRGDGQTYKVEVRVSDDVGYNYHQTTFTTSNEDSVETIYFSELSQQQGWGTTVDFNQNNITNIAIVAHTDLLTDTDGDFEFKIWDFGLPRRIELTSLPEDINGAIAILLPTSANMEEYIEAMLTAYSAGNLEYGDGTEVAQGSGEAEDNKATIPLRNKDEGRWIGSGNYNLLLFVIEEFMIYNNDSFEIKDDAEYFIYTFSGVNVSSPKIERSISGTPAATGTFGELFGSWECTCEACQELSEPCGCSVLICHGDCDINCECWVDVEVTVSNVVFTEATEENYAYLTITFTTADTREGVLSYFLYVLENLGNNIFDITSDDGAEVIKTGGWKLGDNGYQLNIEVAEAGTITITVDVSSIPGYNITQYTTTITVTADDDDEGGGEPEPDPAP